MSVDVIPAHMSDLITALGGYKKHLREGAERPPEHLCGFPEGFDLIVSEHTVPFVFPARRLHAGYRGRLDNVSLRGPGKELTNVGQDPVGPDRACPVGDLIEKVDHVPTRD